MIPKIIHYCWFGGKKKPSSVRKYMDTWSRMLPDYTFKEWNEDTFNVNSIPFTAEAYANKKYAFVSDYVRLFALYTEGGIYLDTDVEVIKSFDELLDIPAFMGYDDIGLCTAVIGAEPQNPFIYECLEEYNQMHFDYNSMQPNPKVLLSVMSRNGFSANFERGEFNGCLQLFPANYFSALSFYTFEQNISTETYTIHHYAASWFSPAGRFYRKFLNAIGPKGRALLFKTVTIIKSIKN